MTATRSDQTTYEEQRDALTEKIFGLALATGEAANVYIGDRLGFYRSLAQDGPATSAELARRTGSSERMVREWLEQQVVAGVLDVDDTGAPLDKRTFTLPAPHAEALTDERSLAYAAPFARYLIGCANALPLVMEAFRTGKGVPYDAFGPDIIESQADVNRPMLEHLLTQEWLPAVPDVHEKLLTGARVADVGCGAAWSSIAIARGYPSARVDGFDLDEHSVKLARRNVTDAGLSERVTVHQQDAGDGAFAKQFDLALAIECIHDLSRPVDVLRAMRNMLAAGGTAIVADERTADAFTVTDDPMERLFYAFSTLLCLPAGMADEPSAATGTVMRASTLETYATDAGFQRVEVLPIEHAQFRFYRLHP
ncbi:MAG: methyltransferase domain-containing protein [Dehalococcoidia bacterium]